MPLPSYLCRWFLVLYFVSQTSCSPSVNYMTKGELLTNTTRTYSRLPPSTILAAADKLLVYVDSSGFRISHEPTSLTAIKQHYSDEPSGGWRKQEETWVILAKPLDEGSLAILTVERTVTTLFGPTTVRPTGPATYAHFWKRLEYFLGLTDRDTTCTDNQRAIENGETWGEPSWLCET